MDQTELNRRGNAVLIGARDVAEARGAMEDALSSTWLRAIGVRYNLLHEAIELSEAEHASLEQIEERLERAGAEELGALGASVSRYEAALMAIGQELSLGRDQAEQTLRRITYGKMGRLQDEIYSTWADFNRQANLAAGDIDVLTQEHAVAMRRSSGEFVDNAGRLRQLLAAMERERAILDAVLAAQIQLTNVRILTLQLEKAVSDLRELISPSGRIVITQAEEPPLQLVDEWGRARCQLMVTYVGAFDDEGPLEEIQCALVADHEGECDTLPEVPPVQGPRHMDGRL